MRFIDEATIRVRSGKGGHGCVSFRREKYVPRGGPDGGEGGRGGDVIFRAEPRMLSLYDFRHKRSYEAKNGQGGAGADRFGADGEDLTVNVPPGTMIFEVGEDDEETLLADLTNPGDTAVICKGGRGGKGNAHFKSSTMRTPRFAQQGEEGEAKVIRLELRILADAGLLGLPNAGKSTFISAISAAKPKIAPYPFTTLTPNLGVIKSDLGEIMVVADIPGLIEGAHAGAGLGHTFLRHVERTKFLVHILSVQDVNPDDPLAGYALLNAELAKFSRELRRKPQILVMNKIDLLTPEALETLRAACRAKRRKVFFISAMHGQGLEEVVEAMWKLRDKHAAAGAEATE